MDETKKVISYGSASTISGIHVNIIHIKSWRLNCQRNMCNCLTNDNDEL